MNLQTIKWQNNAIKIIDQTRLPQKLQYLSIKDLKSLWQAIKVLRVRGAPALGAAGGLGAYLGIKDSRAKGFTAFKEELEKVTKIGYDPNFDDGVILNMAPIHVVIPWNEPAKYWKELESGKYDWAHIAMKYWPERIKEKCKKDKSLAIAHNIK